MITLPLLPGTDGRKMSKSYGNAIGVADTPRDMYGKVMRIADELIPTYLEVACLLMPGERVTQLQQDFQQGRRNPIEIKEDIAHHAVSIYHGAPVADAERAWFREHIRGRKLPDATDIPEATVSLAQLEQDASWAGLLAGLGLVKSKGEVRRLIQGGGLKVDGERITDPVARWDGTGTPLVQYGKRRFVRLHLNGSDEG